MSQKLRKIWLYPILLLFLASKILFWFPSSILRHLIVLDTRWWSPRTPRHSLYVRRVFSSRFCWLSWRVLSVCWPVLPLYFWLVLHDFVVYHRFVCLYQVLPVAAIVGLSRVHCITSDANLPCACACAPAFLSRQFHTHRFARNNWFHRFYVLIVIELLALLSSH